MTTSGCQVDKNLLEFIFDMDAREDLLDCLLGNVVLLNEADRIILLNKGAEKVLGMSRDEILGRNFWAAPWNPRGLNDPTGTEGKDWFRDIMKTVHPAHTELLLDRPDGSWGAYQVKATPWIRDAKCQGFMVAFTDITDRRKAELERNRLADEREKVLAKLNATVHFICHGVAIYDIEGRLVQANPEARSLAGLPPRCDRSDRQNEGTPVIVETPDGQPVPPERLPEHRALSGERFHGDTLIFRHSPKKALSVSIAGSPIFHQGKLIGAILSFSDCTKPGPTGERTRSFMQILANKLRHHFGAIQGYAEILKGDLFCLPWEQEEDCISAIMRTSRKISRMMDDLLKTTYLKDINETDPELASFIPDDVIGRILRENRTTLNRERIIVDIPANLPPMCLEYGHLERIVLNLLTSTLKLTSDEKAVRIRAETLNKEVVFAVTGGGNGIDKSDLPKIFSRFFHSEFPTKFDGIGFDLYIVRRLTEVHGGRVWIKTLPDGGNTFCFAFPAGKCPD